jgi:hypothetical protein
MDEITFDLATLTLGEAAEIEMASGHSLQELLRSKVSIRLMAVFVQRYRSSGVVPSWQELSSLRLLDGTLSTSPLDSAETPAK